MRKAVRIRRRGYASFTADRYWGPPRRIWRENYAERARSQCRKGCTTLVSYGRV